LEFRSWQEHLLGSVELRKEPAAIALRAHDQGRTLQLLDRGFTVCHLPELNSMLAEWVFKLCEPELHLQNLGRKGFTKADSLFSGPPVREVCRRTGTYSRSTLGVSRMPTVFERGNARSAVAFA